MAKKVLILETSFVTHNVKRFVLEKPQGYKFVPGQATEVSINQADWKKEKRPFTFASLNNNPHLEFIIKAYPEHHGVTERLHQLGPGDELLLGEPFGTINYKSSGVFLAGGAGITPFIAILRQLNKEGKVRGNSLVFSNKTQKDIILEKELREMFAKNEDLIFTLTRERKKGYQAGRIDKEFLKKRINDFSQDFYICGPPEFVKDINSALKALGVKADSLVFEK
jgi:ferredoxin-NADP reductase